MTIARSISLVAAIILMTTATARAISPQDIIDNVQEKYESVTDATVLFVQSVSFKVSRAEQTSSGKLYFKKKNQYRIETDTRTVVTDGKTSWSYNPQNKQVIIDDFKEESHSMAPDKLLLTFPEDHYVSLVGEETLDGEDCYVLKLTPKDENSFTTGMKIWVNDDWVIKRVEVTDINGATTTYTIKKITFNTGIQASTFHFEAPPGTDEIDLR
ncbi:MAG: outer membrane lipoprotein carrier protein LolA [Ectothiorhodospiraceae bacterium]|nr:outer membrane lipoprotein carrier protein LolA [Ectothiorhodospiraceae bacterium]